MHVNCLRIGTKRFWMGQYHLQHAAKAHHANKLILEDRVVFISQRLRCFDAGVSGRHRTIYRERIQTLDLHVADPLRALRRTFTGHSNDMKFCTLGTNEQHIVLPAQRLRVGPEFVVVRIGRWQLTLPNVNAWDGYKESCIGNLWGKGGCAGQNSVGRANWKCIVVTKALVTGRKQHKI